MFPSQRKLTQLTQEDVAEILPLVVTSFTPYGEVNDKIYLPNINYKEKIKVLDLEVL